MVITVLGWRERQICRGSNEKAFFAAVFMANHLWLLKSRSVKEEGRSLLISYDMGIDTKVPAMSLAGMIVVSVLLGLFLIGLGIMALYASTSPNWTPTLDAFAMMRLGAALSEEVQLLAGDEL
jgi:hypothetical protein